MTITTTRAIFVAASSAFLASLAACGGDSCFVRGTKVRTPKGDKNIEDLVVGDEVLAYDGEHVVVRTVLACHERNAPEVFSVRAGDVVIGGVSAEHPFWDESVSAWRPLRALTLQSRLITLHDGRLNTANVVELRRAGGASTVLNLSVSSPENNYFVEGVLVHNKTYSCVEDSDCSDDGTARCDIFNEETGEQEEGICVPVDCTNDDDCEDDRVCDVDAGECVIDDEPTTP